jgi:hypothetical protein
MPYSGQQAGKTGHADLIDNPEIREFIKGANYLRTPSDAEIQAITSSFQAAPKGGRSPKFVLATDGSTYEGAIDTKFPSTRVGYVKISNIVIDVERYRSLLDGPTQSRAIDPFEINDLQRQVVALTAALPSSNMLFGHHKSVRDAFRYRLLEVFDSPSTRLGNGTLVDTLFEMASRTDKRIRVIGGVDHLVVGKCPSCDSAPQDGIPVSRSTRRGLCSCGAEVLATDALRTDEGVTDNGSNQEAITRVMNALEVLLVAHYIIELSREDKASLARWCFLVDGPLAVFGEPAWLSRAMLRLVSEVNTEIEHQHGRFLVIGLPKSGPLAEHAASIARYLKPDTIRLIDDDYRNRHVRPVDSGSNFGNDTYYGQDFIFRSGGHDAFVVSVSYPFPSKGAVAGVAFKDAKTDISAYQDLGRALDVVRTFECDLYTSSIVPMIIAHRHASISRVPGGKVLDVAGMAAFSAGHTTNAVGGGPPSGSPRV